MKILVLNCGSSSIKSQVIETSVDAIASDSERRVARAVVEKVGSRDAIVTRTDADGRRSKYTKAIGDFEAGIAEVLDGVTGIEGVGHRVVHGGEKFTEPTPITAEVLEQIVDLIDLAPLHNPHNLKGYYAAKKLLPDVRQVAVFDTAFHHTLPERAYLYGLPYSYYVNQKIRRYGFHGVSHRYVSYRYAEIHGKKRNDFKLITCHLGNGASICAIDQGVSIDTSMGFTPLEGLLMGTRCGDLDPSIVLTLMEQESMNVKSVENLLNRHSGLYGVSGLSADMRTLLEHGGSGDRRAEMAVDLFCYRAKKYIGAYMAALNGADAVLFTGGIGENAPRVRARICEAMNKLGIEIDEAANDAGVGVECRIGKGAVDLWAIPTDEELLIARDTFRCIAGLPHPY